MEFLPLLLVPFIVIALLIQGIVWVVNWLIQLRASRRRRIEAELDRTQAELRATILNLASQLGADAHEARKALIRESYLMSGNTPPQQ